MPFQIGCAYPTPLGALERIARAVEFAPSAVQVILPDWWPTSLQESVLFLRQAAHTAGTIPLVLYHPPHAKRALSPSELSILCDQIPSLVGLKTGAGDADWYRSMQPVLQRISVFVPGHTLATGFAQGAAGAYSNVACLHPCGAVRWNRLMESDLPQALLIERFLQRFMNQAILPFREQYGHSNMALDKLLAWIGNWSEMSTRLRPPYLGIDPSHAEGLRERARSEIPFLFEED
jgi:dihydrodipicolinate synthase/N-acetylneuraminate lyase